MIELTDEMVQALWAVLPSEVQEGREPDDVEAWVDAVLVAIESSGKPWCPGSTRPAITICGRAKPHGPHDKCARIDCDHWHCTPRGRQS